MGMDPINGGASPNSAKIIQRIMSDPAFKMLFSRDEQAVQTIASIFGVPSPHDEGRYKLTQEKILPLLARPENAGMLRELTELIKAHPEYRNCTATSFSRFYPLALAMNNMRERKVIASSENIAKLPGNNAIRLHMEREHPLANIHGLDPKYVPVARPSVIIDISDPCDCLDIGSGPKTGGASIHKVAKEIHPTNFKYTGIDVLMPYFELKGDKIVYSQYVKDGKINDSSEVNGVTYLNGKRPRFDVTMDGFMTGADFDIITVCMVLHYFTGNTKYPCLDPLPHEFDKKPFTTWKLVNNEGKDFSEEAKMHIHQEQQKVIDRLLGHLNVGGMLFINLRPFPPYKDLPHDVAVNENNIDLFFIIKRRSADTFVIYDKDPIVFCLAGKENTKWSPSIERGFINGTPKPSYSGAPMPVSYQHDGIASYCTMSDKKKVELQQLFYRAELLAAHYQSWKKSIWGSVQAVTELIRQKAELPEIFEAYIRNVPDDASDPNHSIRRQLMSDVEAFTRSLSLRRNGR